MKEVKITLDGTKIQQMLSALSNLADRLPEFRDGLLRLIDSGEEIFRVDGYGFTAAITSELLVRLNPSEALLGPMSTTGAGDCDLLFLEQRTSPIVEFTENNTTLADNQLARGDS